MAILHPEPYPMPEDHEYAQPVFESLAQASAELPESEIKGALLRYPVADGYAFYLVTSAKPLTLQWLAYGDCWTAPDALIRGLRVSDVKEQLANSRALRKLFSSAAGR